MKSKDGLRRFDVTIKIRVSLWDLLVVACSYTEQTDKRLASTSAIIAEYKKTTLEYGQFWDTDIWCDDFTKVCRNEFPYYIDLMGLYFNSLDVEHAYKTLQMYC